MSGVLWPVFFVVSSFPKRIAYFVTCHYICWCSQHYYSSSLFQCRRKLGYVLLIQWNQNDLFVSVLYSILLYFILFRFYFGITLFCYCFSRIYHSNRAIKDILNYFYSILLCSISALSQVISNLLYSVSSIFYWFINFLALASHSFLSFTSPPSLHPFV